MEIKIHRLTPDMAEEYVHFFDVTPHDINVDEHKCYCVLWRNDDSYKDLGHWFPTREERRSRAIEFIKAGSLQGYLAYYNNEIVGWCNANADCQFCLKHLSQYWSIEKCSMETRVKSIFCFMIAPKMQRKGIATQLLERVCKDATDEGYDYVEAYVGSIDKDQNPYFGGPLAMYEKCDFAVCGEKEGRVTVRKALK